MEPLIWGERMVVRSKKPEIKKRASQKGSSHTLKKTDLKQKEHSCIIKRRTGACEPYDEKKVYGSVYAACSVVHLSEQECEHIAEDITLQITTYLKKKKSCSSIELKDQIIERLKKYNEHVAFMYGTHDDIN